MITDLAGLLRPERAPRRGQRWQAGAGRALHINQRPGLEPVALLEQPRRLAQQLGGERRIQEHQVEGPRLAGEVAQGVRAHHARIARLPFGEPRAQLAHGRLIVLDERHVRCAARQRLEPERPAAGEQVERTRSRRARPQPVEERLAHAVGGRTDGGGCREAHLSATPRSPDDAHNARPAGALHRDGCAAA